MSTFDATKPLTTDNYSTVFVPTLQGNFASLAFGLDPTYVTAYGTLSTGMQRLNRTGTGLWEFWNGSAWAAVATGYILKGGDTVTGNLAFNNNVAIYWKDAGAANRLGAVLDTGNIFRFGDVNNALAGTTAIMGGAAITMAINGATKATFNANGMGVGVAPAVTLDLLQPVNTTAQINLLGSGAYSSVLNMGAAGGGSAQIKSSAQMLFFTAGVQAAAIDGNQNLGIGGASSSASMKIYAVGASGATSFNIDDTNASGYSSYRLGNGTGAPAGNGAALHYMNSSYAQSGAYYPSGTTLTANGSGGLNLNAQNASGGIRFFVGSGPTLAAQIATNGTVGFLTPSSAAATNGNWYAAPAYTVFGPNAAVGNGANFGIGYNTTLDQSELLSLAPGVAWKPMAFFGSSFSWTTSGSNVRMTMGASGGPGLVVSAAATTTPAAMSMTATTMTADMRSSNVFTGTLTGNIPAANIAWSNFQDGQTINFFLTQDATGSRTVTWPTSFKWPGGTVGVLSTTPNAVDLLVLTYRAATGFFYCTLAKAFA